MRLIAMSATLSAAIIGYSAVDVGVPILSTLSRSGEPVRALSAARASVPPGQAAPARVALPVVLPGAEAAHARGCANRV